MTTQTQTKARELNPPREGTKQAKLVAMLSRKSGVTLTKASETLGWLPPRNVRHDDGTSQARLRHHPH